MYLTSGSAGICLYVSLDARIILFSSVSEKQRASKATYEGAVQRDDHLLLNEYPSEDGARTARRLLVTSLHDDRISPRRLAVGKHEQGRNEKGEGKEDRRAVEQVSDGVQDDALLPFDSIVLKRTWLGLLYEQLFICNVQTTRSCVQCCVR